jgi:hypothetical protein
MADTFRHRKSPTYRPAAPTRGHAATGGKHRCRRRMRSETAPPHVGSTTSTRETRNDPLTNNSSRSPRYARGDELLEPWVHVTQCRARPSSRCLRMAKVAAKGWRPSGFARGPRAARAARARPYPSSSSSGSAAAAEQPLQARAEQGAPRTGVRALLHPLVARGVREAPSTRPQSPGNGSCATAGPTTAASADGI